MNSEQTNEIAAALAKAQGQMENAKYNKINPHFKNKYADLAAIIDAIKQPLADNGIGYTQTTHADLGDDTGLSTIFRLTTKLLHSSGQWISSEYPLPYAPDKPQVMGAALTYARRYELATICGIAAEEDNDAEGVAEDVGARKPPKPAPDVIKHDPKTGEVLLPSELHRRAAAEIPQDDDTGPTEMPGEIPVEDMAREAASRGRAVFFAWYKRCSKAEKNLVEPIMAELKETVEAVEAAEQGQGS
jgi:hypothetical protein